MTSTCSAISDHPFAMSERHCALRSEDGTAPYQILVPRSTGQLNCRFSPIRCGLRHSVRRSTVLRYWYVPMDGVRAMTTADKPLELKLPDGPKLPRGLQGVAFILFRRQFMATLRRKYGPSFMVEVPVFGRA